MPAIVRLLEAFADPVDGNTGRASHGVVSDVDHLSFSADSRLPVLAVCSRPALEAEHRKALQAGAAGLIDITMSVHDAEMTWRAARSNYYRLPVSLGQGIASRLDTVPIALQITDQDLFLLWAVRRGETMAAIGNRLGCSERQARRHARSLWERLGVTGRSEGLVRATQLGIIH